MKNCIKCLKQKSQDNFESGRNQCKDCRKTFAKSYYKSYFEKNKDKLLIGMRTYSNENRDDLMRKNNEYSKKRYQTDINFKLSKSLRSRLSHAIRDNQKTGSAVKDLGCSVGEFKVYLESKFHPEMSWDNYGPKGWHIDHILPLSKFDLSNHEELKKACHYTNLQPMWAEDNWSKGAKWH
jgi:hypothetical protein